MGKRQRRHRDQRKKAPGVEELLARGDTRGAVEAAKALVRERPGEASEALAVRAYAERIKRLIAEGMGREAAALAAIVRERFPAHVASCADLLEDARLAAGDFDWILGELKTASDERRAAIESRLTGWIVDPSSLARASALDRDDPLIREAGDVAEVFEIVTSRMASPEEMARLDGVRRRSPLAPWKLLIRAIDAYYRNDDQRVAANVAAIDSRSPAARGAQVLSDLTTGSRKTGGSFAAERLIDRISGGRATIAEQIRGIKAAVDADDRRRVRDGLRTLSKSFDKLTPYALEQVRLALLPVCGPFFEPEQIAPLFRIDRNDPVIERYAALLMEISGFPIAHSTWVVYASQLLEDEDIEPWQAAEIYLHALSLDSVIEKDLPFLFLDDDEMDDEMDDERGDGPDTAEVIEMILDTRPSPSVMARVIPFIDRLEWSEQQPVLSRWREIDPQASEPLVRLLRLADREPKVDSSVLSLIREGDRMKIIDPEYARLRLRLLLRRTEELLGKGKRGPAAAVLEQIAQRPGDLGDDVDVWLLALRWAAATPAKARKLLDELAGRGVVAEMAVAEIAGILSVEFPLPASHHSPEEQLEGVRRGLTMLRSVCKLPQYSAWVILRTEIYLDRANEAQLLAVGSSAMAGRAFDLTWKTTTVGLKIHGAMLHRMLLLRAEVLIELRIRTKRTILVIEAARLLAQRAGDDGIVARAEELANKSTFRWERIERLSEPEIADIIDRELASPMPTGRKTARPRAKKRPPSPEKPTPKRERGLFDP